MVNRLPLQLNIAMWMRIRATTGAARRYSQSILAYDPECIRNFSIIAHIDHGKSTLADRLLEISGTIDRSSTGNKQVLDTLKVERERGITVKAQTATMFYTSTMDGKRYMLNLIDTPGHVDFSYEVSRSLAACQGTILLVDASQGIQAQSIANFYLAFSQGLVILPVLNKVDLPAANVPAVQKQIESAFDLDASNIACISAKSGLNVQALFEKIIHTIPQPMGDRCAPFRALLFDTWYDKYVGVVCLLAIKDGTVRKGDKICSGQTSNVYEVTAVGIMYPGMTPIDQLSAGHVGYVTMNLKTARDVHIGDTFYHQGKPTELFENFHPAKSMVFAGLYPMDASEYQQLSESLDRLTLNDSSVSVQKETSHSLGQGFRLGFLGTLHMDVFRQRLEDEHDTTIINTSPTVPYLIQYTDGREVSIKNPDSFPEQSEVYKVKAFLEPMVIGTLVFPGKYLGKMITLCNNHRGDQQELQYIDDDRIMLKYKFPMAEVLTVFYDSLKSGSSGYATFDYQEIGYEAADLVKVNILLNGTPVDSLACIVHRTHADRIAKDWISRLKDVIDRFILITQAAI